MITASERFRKYLAGEPVDRCPCIEWAPWWKLTVERWKDEGLPENLNTSKSRMLWDRIARFYMYRARNRADSSSSAPNGWA